MIGRLMGGQPNAACVLALLALLALADQARSMTEPSQHTIHEFVGTPHDQFGDASSGFSTGPTLDELPIDELPGEAGSRKLMQAVLGGPLPGFTFIPGFPSARPLSRGTLGLAGRIGALGTAAVRGAVAGDIAFASYVVNGQDPVAIALRQLSIVAIEAYGTAVQNNIKRATKAIDAQLARYQAYLRRQTGPLKDASMNTQLAQIQREIRALVIARAALKDWSAREVANVKFLTAASSAWTSWFYGIQYRFTTLTFQVQWANDPLQIALNRVLYNLGDVTRLVGLLLRPYIRAFKFEQRFFNELYNIIFDEYVAERNRFTVTPTAVFNDPIGSGKNLQAIIDRVTEFGNRLGSGQNAAELLNAARQARDQVAAALAVPAGDNASALDRLANLLRNRAASRGSSSSDSG
ncbi:hypothetical protein GPECTOR_6g701 [Gonium pectorale]|uniref:Uncharacterized protein n=1 Tax=Gonium pectorale TaxID=33097 RepID=A0A150GVJ8_GONPE|nr:hypothetical protein GPECTOR_6g701 [Gonium pectorale]|eukprot:KXZ53783.1 hypothetical protein GPECTOR_6g701 [Gonium pectorale]